MALLKPTKKAMPPKQEHFGTKECTNTIAQVNRSLSFESKYTVLNQLGRGGHSTVNLCKQKDGKLFACKFMPVEKVKHWEGRIPKGIQIMKLLKGKGSAFLFRTI